MTLQEELLLFSHREIKAKDVFYIKEIAKPQAYEFVSKYHYLGDAKFFCEQPKPTMEETFELACCNGTGRVYDNRFGEWYTCPRCTGRLEKLEEV